MRLNCSTCIKVSYCKFIQKTLQLCQILKKIKLFIIHAHDSFFLFFPFVTNHLLCLNLKAF